MALNEQQIAEAVGILAAAQRSRTTIDGLPGTCLPTTSDDGIAIQTALRAELGIGAGSWKAGFTSPAALEKAGPIGPMLGLMPDSMIQASPGTFRRADFTFPLIEFEIAYRMASDLPPRDGEYSQDEVLDAVDSALVGIEVADTRFNDFMAQPIPAMIADNGAVGGYVTGPDIAGWRDMDLRGLTIDVFGDGEKVAEGLPREGRCDEAWVLTWMANKLAQIGPGLKAGQLVSTGAAATPKPAGTTREWRGVFEGIGEIAVTLE